MERNPKLKRDNKGENAALRLPVVTTSDEFWSSATQDVDNQQIYGGKKQNAKTGSTILVSSNTMGEC